MAKVKYNTNRGFNPLNASVLGILAGKNINGNLTYSNLLGSWSTVSASVALSGDNVTYTSSSTSGYAYQDIAVTPGNQYVISSTLVTISTGGNTSIDIVDGSDTYTKTLTTSDSLSISIIPVNSTIRIKLYNASVGDSTYNNLLFYAGIHDYASTNGLKPVNTVAVASIQTGSENYKYDMTSGYIIQDYYNSDLDFLTTNTKEHCYVGWVNIPSSITSGTILHRGFTSGSDFKLSLSAGKLVYSISDDSSTYDTVTSTVVINDGVDHLVSCVLRNVLIGTASEKQVLEIWIDDALDNYITVSNATNILTNGSAKLTLGNNYAASDALGGGYLWQWRASSVAPTSGIIHQVFTDELEMIKEYSVFRLYGSEYEIIIRYSALDERFENIQSRDRSYGRAQQSVVFNEGRSWSISTIKVKNPSIIRSEYVDFLKSTINATKFQFALDDRYTYAYTDNIDFTPAREGKLEYFTYSFNITEA